MAGFALGVSLRDGSGATVDWRTQAGIVALADGVTPAGLLGASGTVLPGGPGTGAIMDGYGVAPSAASTAPAPAASEPATAQAAPAVAASGVGTGVRVDLGGAPFGAMTGVAHVDLGTGTGSGAVAGVFGSGGTAASGTVASPGTGSAPGAQASAMTATGPVWDGTVSTPAATPSPALPGTTALSDAAKRALDRPETLPADPDAGTPRATVTTPTPTLPNAVVTTPTTALPNVLMTQGSGADGAQGVQTRATIAPTPRDGVVGGVPTGTPETLEANDDWEKQESIAIQNASGNALAAVGCRVHWQPEVRPQDNLGPDKKPDMRLGDNIADVVAPTSPKPDQVRKASSNKVNAQQTHNLVLNLSRTSITREQVEALLGGKDKEIAGLRELIITEKNGAVYRFLPEPEQITPGR